MIWYNITCLTTLFVHLFLSKDICTRVITSSKDSCNHRIALEATTNSEVWYDPQILLLTGWYQGIENQLPKELVDPAANLNEDPPAHGGSWSSWVATVTWTIPRFRGVPSDSDGPAGDDSTQWAWVKSCWWIVGEVLVNLLVNDLLVI